MPRLTNSNYLKQRRQLVSYWEDEHFGWTALSPEEQWALHDYYEPSKQLTDAAALEHRHVVTKAHPSLPARAGKAYVLITNYQSFRLPAAAHPPAVTPGKRATRRATDYTVRIKATVCPDPDYDRLARILLQLAKEKADTDKS